MKIAFIITRKKNNVVVSFGTLKVQSFMLTEVRECDLLKVYYSKMDKSNLRISCTWNGGRRGS